ncbi:MAG: MFS transporter [Elusimicrobiales bacterium]|nr:MFS transporter [Elusimicrobiales bacterium]
MVNPNTVLLITVLASFSTPFTLSSINVALPAMAPELGLDALALGWVSLSFLLASAALLVPMGRAADLFGRKKVFTAGFVVFTAASLLCGLAGSAAQLLAARALQGLGSSMIFGTSVAILTSVFPPEKRGKALGWVSAAVYTGLSLGPPLGGLLVQHASWRLIFLLNVPLGLLVLFLVRRGLAGAEWKGAEGEKFDIAGALLYAASLAALMYGLSSITAPGGKAFAAAGAAALALFLWRETKVAHPVLNAGLFLENRVFAFSNLAALLSYSATFAAGFLLSLHLQYAAGLTPGKAGLVLVFQPLFMVAFSPWAGRLSDRHDPGVIASLGMALTAAALLFFAEPSAGLPLWRIISGLSLLGLGLALFASPNTNAVMGSVQKRYYSVASATLATMRVTGQMFSMAVVTLLFSVFIGRIKLGPENVGGLERAFGLAVWLFSALAALGVAASLARRRAA